MSSPLYRSCFQVIVVLPIAFILSAFQCTNADLLNAKTSEKGESFRIASYNIAMFGSDAEEVMGQLSHPDTSRRFQRLAEVIQEVEPDILVLMEIDYHSENRITSMFQKNFLEQEWNGSTPISYDYHYQIVSNTGILSGVDLDGNGTVSLPNDAFGFGRYPGQYASAILSKYPLDLSSIRSFQKFLWKDMPNAVLPANEDGSSYYSEEAMNVFRLSSKNHMDVPVVMPDGSKLHILISHPTPGVFDGPEDRNGKRNHDEIRLWADYISGAEYLVDDSGKRGGLQANENFVIIGDLNADPMDGDSYHNAINQLLEHPRVNQMITSGDRIPKSDGGKAHNQRKQDKGDPAYDTSFFGLRIDYVIPGKRLKVLNSGVFWPAPGQKGFDLVANKNASDHLLVWADLQLP